MSYRPVLTEEFRRCLNDLKKRGGVGKKVEKSARAAMSEYQTEGRITSFAETHHGENRLPNVTKYDLGENNHRLVVQRVDGKEKVLAFLYVGPHEETQRWLDNHRDYVWAQRSSDRTLEFVQATTYEPRPTTINPEVEPDESSRPAGPLLAVVAAEVRAAPFPKVIQEYLLNVTGEAMERDEMGVFQHLLDKSDETSAFAAHDLLHHAYRQEWPQLHARLEILSGQAAVVEGKALAEAMLDDANSERFVDFDDLRNLPEDLPWDKWLVFLSPKQKEFARKPLDGPARLRGVSGSGKTCVLLHRAYDLANRHGPNALIVTSTESMRLLLSHLLDELGGASLIRKRIETKTIAGLAREIICSQTGCQAADLQVIDSANRDAMLQETLGSMPSIPGFEHSGLSQLSSEDLGTFVDEEITYLRSRLRAREYERYLESKKFVRRGRGRGLTAEGRQVCIFVAVAWEEMLSERKAWDDLALVQFALEQVEQDSTGLDRRAGKNTSVRAWLAGGFNSRALPHFRNVLVDEVQDLSQLEISLLAAYPAEDGKNAAELPDGLYLVGDGAQTIYKRGFNFRDCGITLPGARSFALKRNYRNTREILEAAFEIIRGFEFTDVGEESLAAPMLPEFALEHGPRPTIVACDSLQDEISFVAGEIEKLRRQDGADENQTLGTVVGVPSLLRHFPRMRYSSSCHRAS